MTGVRQLGKTFQIYFVKNRILFTFIVCRISITNIRLMKPSQSMRLVILFFFNIIILLFFAGCKHHNMLIYKNGFLQTFYDNDELHENIYYLQNKKNGIYIEYEKGHLMKTLGTFRNDSRNGLWSTYINGEINKQQYFSNDSEIFSLKNRVLLAPHYDSIIKICFLMPYGWKSHTDSIIIMSAYSQNHPSAVKPNYNIIQIGTDKKQIDSVVSEQIYALESVKSIKILEIKKNIITIGMNKDGLDIISNLKIIQGGDDKFYLLTCMSLKSDYNIYRLLFDTMTTSFASIS